jgi:hypothetical protein
LAEGVLRACLRRDEQPRKNQLLIFHRFSNFDIDNNSQDQLLDLRFDVNAFVFGPRESGCLGGYDLVRGA